MEMNRVPSLSTKIARFAESVRRAHRVYLCGNGGSAANAIHIANDLMACGVKAHALTADVATLTAIANDISYGAAFSTQLRTLQEPRDLLIVLSGSGNSKNICQALECFQGEKWAILGEFNPDPKARQLVKAENLILLGQDMQQAEQEQLRIGHELMRWLKNS